MYKNLKYLLVKLLIVITLIVVFASIYKRMTNDTWTQCIYISTFNQTLTGPPEVNNENVKKVIIVQNIIAYSLLIGAFYLFVHINNY
jgi:hypothetical protein